MTKVHEIDGKEYIEVDRKAEVGERVIVVDNSSDGFSEGFIGEVTNIVDDIDVINGSYGHFREDYRVLVPVESETAPESLADVVANLVRRVAEQEREQKAMLDVYEKDKRWTHRRIDGIKDDLVTWSQEIENVKHSVIKAEPSVEVVETDASIADSVNHPRHYKTGRFETIEVIEDITAGYSDGYIAYCVGNSLKYLSRAPYKHESPAECLRKAKRYIEFALAHIEKEDGA